MKKLFEKYKMGSIELANRVVMAPLTRSRAIQNIPNDLMAEYYSTRATAGLLITEGTSPSPNGLGYARIPGIYSTEQIAGWKKVTSAVHKNGGKIFLQMMHTGRVSHPDNMPKGAQILAPSAVTLGGTMWTDQNGPQPHPTPKEMTMADIQQAQNEYVQGSLNAIQAGFDGVELHAANGYLLEQFLNPNSNKRNDQYGGSTENRLRFLVEVAEKVVKAIGAERVGLRISPYGAFNEMGPFEGIDQFYGELATKMSSLKLTYIHVVDHASMGAPAVSPEVKRLVRENFKGTYILSGGYTAEKAEQDLIENKGDLVAFGRPFIANPNLVEKLKTGAPLKEPDANKFYTPGPEGYTDY